MCYDILFYIVLSHTYLLRDQTHPKSYVQKLVSIKYFPKIRLKAKIKFTLETNLVLIHPMNN